MDMKTACVLSKYRATQQKRVNVFGYIPAALPALMGQTIEE